MIVKNGLLGKRGNVVTIEATADLVKLLADDASARLARSDRCQLILGGLWAPGRRSRRSAFRYYGRIRRRDRCGIIQRQGKALTK
jgi:hypothetical protein